MTKYTIKLSDLFGSAYYDYNITTDSYNAGLNTNITVTCTLKNIFGNPVSNKELTLYYKGTSQGVQTTNSNGIAQWTFNTGTTGGTFKISINNHCIFINVGGFKLVQSHSGGHYFLYVDELTRTARLRIYFDGTKNIGTGNTYIASGFIDSQYRPLYNLITTITRSGTLLGYIFPTGEVGVTNNSGSTINSPNFSSIIEWSY